MLRKILAATLPVAASVGLVFGGAGERVATSASPCTSATRVPSFAAAVARGAPRSAAVVGRAIRLTGASGSPVEIVPGGAARHVALADGRVAFVRDRRGDDEVVVLDESGTDTFPQRGEASHPSWSPAGALVWAVDDRLGFVPAGKTRAQTIAGPGTGALFSPVFADEETVVAVVSSPPSRRVPEGEHHNDLVALDLASGSWRRMTAFESDAQRWVAIRTPVAAAPGVVEFVLVRADASATTTPSFELWRATADGVGLVRTLPGERYLAGVAAGRRLWNVPDHASATWRLLQEGADGRLEQIGCGAVSVDPLDRADPDRTSIEGHADVRVEGRLDPAREVERGPSGDESSATPSAPLGLVVGDFVSPAEAQGVLERIRSIYGDGAPVSVVDHAHATSFVAPGAWAVLLTLPAGADVDAEVAMFRQRLPEFAERSWVVAP